MVTTVGGSTKEIMGKLSYLYLTAAGGTEYLFASAKNWRIRYGYRDVEEYVTGTQIPRVLTGGFHGEFECDLVYTSDDLVNALVTVDATTFELPVVTMKSIQKDVASSQTTKTLQVTIKLFEAELQGPPNADGVVTLRYGRGRMTAVPSYG